MEGTVITKKGIQLLTKILATQGTLNFTRISVGTGTLLNGYDPASMLDLIEYKMDANISKIAAIGDTAEIVMQISSVGIESGFTITEIGVFAEDPDIGEILYAYIDLSDDPQYIYPEGGQAVKFVEVTLDIVIIEGTKITACINPASLVTRGDFEEQNKKVENEFKNANDRIDTHLQDYKNPHKVTAEIIGLGEVDNTSDENKPVSKEQEAALRALYTRLKEYIDVTADNLVDGAPDNLDTLKKLADIILKNEENLGNLDSYVDTKASQEDLDTHTGNSEIHTNREEKEMIDSHITNRGNPHKVTAEMIGLGEVDNTSDENKPVSKQQEAALQLLYTQLTGYTDKAIADLIGGAPITLDTLKEIADAILENEDIVEALNESIGKKANQTELDTHTENAVIHITKAERDNWNGMLPKTDNAVSASKWKISRNINGMSVDGSGNCFNYGSCSTAAETAAKTVACTGFTLAVGAEITVKFTVTNTAANPTLNVNGTGAKPIYYRGKGITAGYLAANRTYDFRYNGTQYELVGDIDTNTTYANVKAATDAEVGKAGLVPAPEAGGQGKYLTGAATWENVDEHAATFSSGDESDPTGWANIGVVASGEKHNSLWWKFSLAVKNLRYLKKVLGTTDISAIGGGTVTGAISKLNTDLGSKQATINGGASSITSSNLTANRALVSNASGKVAVSAVTAAELGYLDGVSSNVQSQINRKQKSLSIAAHGQVITVNANGFREYNMAPLFGNELNGKIVLVANAKLVNNALGISIGMDPNSNTIIRLWNYTSQTKDVEVILVLLVF